MKSRIASIFISLLAFLVSGCVNENWEDYVYPPAENRDNLEALITQCEDIAANAEVGNMEGQYLQYVLDNFNAAIEEARNIYNNTLATQAMVDAAVADLESARVIFEDSANPGDLDGNDGNLVLHLRFSNNCIDGSSYGHEIEQLAGNALCGSGPAPSLTTDRHGNANSAMHFERGGYLSIPYVEGKSESLNPPVMTFMCWVREPSPAPVQRWIFCLDTWNIFYVVIPVGGTDFQFAGQTTRGWITPALESGISSSADWQHFAVTYSPEEVAFYRNGELVTTCPSTGGNLVENNAHAPFLIGLMSPDRELYFEGDLDEIRLYNTVLSESEIYSVFNLEKPDNMVIDKSALAYAIETARNEMEAAETGFAQGQYLQSSIDILSAAIEVAQTLYDDDATSQNQADKAAETLAAAVETFLGSKNTVDYDPNLVLHLNFDDNFTDGSYLHHEIALTEGAGGLPPYPAIDRFGNYDGACHFDEGAYISIPFEEHLASGELTYMFWIKAAVPAGTGDPYLLSINRRFHFYIGLDGNEIILGGSSLSEETTGVSAGNEWKHIAVTYSAEKGATLYVNGEESYRQDSAGSLTPVTNNTPFVIGVKGTTDNKSSYFKGDLDEIMVYDRPLSAAEINVIYQQQR